jgi:probable rRNA maturation factor
MIIAHKPAIGVSLAEMQRFLGQARRAAHLRGAVHVALLSDREMRELNLRFRGKNKPTDVLSFPSLPAANRLSGDIAISLDLAAANAVRFGHTTMDELKILVLHGVLHLAGHDHEQDGGEMAVLEERLRRRLGLAGGLIGRSNGARQVSNGRRGMGRALGARRRPPGRKSGGRRSS